MASPAANKGIEIKVAPEALMAIMGTSQFAGMGQGSSGREPLRGDGSIGGGSGDVWMTSPDSDYPPRKAELQGSSGRAETGGFMGSNLQPRDSSLNCSGSPTTPRKTLIGG